MSVFDVPRSIVHSCQHCGTSSPYLLRCSQCRSAWFCNQTCQLLAWNPKDGEVDGHRTICRRLRRRAKAQLSKNGRNEFNFNEKNSNLNVVGRTWRDLVNHVETMDREQAYKQMCLAQDEILRLQQTISREEEFSQKTVKVPGITINSCVSESEILVSVEPPHPDTSNTVVQLPINQKKSITPMPYSALLAGSWLDQGGSCSIEYLPYVKSYLITLTTSHDDCCCVPPSGNCLNLTVTPRDDDLKVDEAQKLFDTSQSSVSFYTVKLYTTQTDNDGNKPNSSIFENTALIFSACLPADSVTACEEKRSIKNCSISLDENSLLLRIQFHDLSLDKNEQTFGDVDTIKDHLLGTEGSAFSCCTTNSEDLNHLSCRTCLNEMMRSILNDRTSQCVIKSVLPLPSGYWDDITDYLTCFDGKSTVDFNSSSTRAIPRTALEDDVALIFHKNDLLDESLCALSLNGYGKKSSFDVKNSYGNDSSIYHSSQSWRDKSVGTGTDTRTIACANCFSTLGFVSNYDVNAYVLYKHLLSCGNSNDTPNNLFAKYTCYTFLAHELIRYAETEAIYTFIVRMVCDDESKLDATVYDQCLLIHILSWDTPMAATNSHSPNRHGFKEQNSSSITFDSVLKVIYDETTIKKISSITTVSADNLMEWTWGGMDLCCSPSLQKNLKTEGNTVEPSIMAVPPRTKATSVIIFLSKREWMEIRDFLVHAKQYFSKSVSDAAVTTKLKMPVRKKGMLQSTFLSFLPIMT